MMRAEDEEVEAASPQNVSSIFRGKEQTPNRAFPLIPLLSFSNSKKPKRGKVNYRFADVYSLK
jgi:hypothetical protein